MWNGKRNGLTSLLDDNLIGMYYIGLSIHRLILLIEVGLLGHATRNLFASNIHRTLHISDVSLSFNLLVILNEARAY